MLERIAKALAPQSWADLENPCYKNNKTSKKKREQSLEFAKKVIHALREPDEIDPKILMAMDHYTHVSYNKISYNKMWDAALDQIVDPS